MIASKSEEVSYIHLKSVISNIVYGKFTKEQLTETELTVLQVINFRVNIPSIYDLCRCGFRLIKFTDKRIEQFFQNSSLLVAKTCLFSLEILNTFSYDEIAAMSMIMVLKIVEKLSPNEDIDGFAKMIVRKFKLDKQTLVNKLQFLTDYTLDFDNIFPYVNNLKKYYSFSYQ